MHEVNISTISVECGGIYHLWSERFLALDLGDHLGDNFVVSRHDEVVDVEEFDCDAASRVEPKMLTNSMRKGVRIQLVKTTSYFIFNPAYVLPNRDCHWPYRHSGPRCSCSLTRVPAYEGGHRHCGIRQTASRLWDDVSSFQIQMYRCPASLL